MIAEQLSEYIAACPQSELPPGVLLKAKQHVLDALAAMASGSRLEPGRLAIRYARGRGGNPECSVAAGGLKVPAELAALANGMLAHADETDDTHWESKTHPGCAIVPAALALAEKEGRTGLDLLRAVVAGYDVACRLTRALGKEHWGLHSTYSIGGTFGAAAAACCLCGFDARRIRWALSYAAQQASGVLSWVRDSGHVEKAFDFGGMPARNGVTAALFVQSGFTAVDDVFEGENNFLAAYSPAPRPQELIEGLGSRYEILATSIKRFPVGAPIQAAADAALLILKRDPISPAAIEQVTVRLPADRAGVVNDREMPDVNVQYILAVLLLDRRLTFESAHSAERMRDPEVLALKARVRLVPDEELMRSPIPRQAIVEIATRDGRLLREHVVSVRGTPQNPMSNEEVEEKALDLMGPVYGAERAREIVERAQRLDEAGSVLDFVSLVRAA
ncbi:MAG TPA: MmgE/PrpD family protein [candidate division Zixibacteria bacterium]|nr:MmgE/PrpD family protein [candidate division Zixibacteria bacterium]